MSYPSIAAGQRLTASLLQSLLPVYVYKSADTTRVSTTTQTADPDLVVPLAANATYYVEMFIHYAAASAELLQTTWITPSGASGLRSAWGIDSTVTANTNATGIGRWAIHGFTTTVVYGTRSTATNQTMALETGNITTTTAGNLSLAWCQNTSGTTGVKVCAGSFIRATRLA